MQGKDELHGIGQVARRRIGHGERQACRGKDRVACENGAAVAATVVVHASCLAVAGRAALPFSPPRPPSCVFAILASVRWLGACCLACACTEDL